MMEPMNSDRAIDIAISLALIAVALITAAVIYGSVSS